MKPAHGPHLCTLSAQERSAGDIVAHFWIGRAPETGMIFTAIQYSDPIHSSSVSTFWQEIPWIVIGNL